MKTFVTMFAIALIFCGCASSGPSPKDQAYLATADYSPYPENYQQIIKDYCSRFLKDPYSAQYTFTEPRQDYIRRGLLFWGGVQEVGWRVDVGLNAKNSFGGYVGEKVYHFMIRDGRVTHVFETINGTMWPADGL